MKRIILLAIWVIFSSSFALSQITLTIEITGIRNNTGNIMLQLLYENEAIVTQQMSEIADNKCSFKLNNIKPGKYVVRYYHDENMNMKMEMNRLGKPTEGYGFSNNATAPFSMPPFKKCLFDISEDTKLVLKPNY